MSNEPTLEDDEGAGAGAASLAGYEYQIDVSVWLALDLVLSSGLTGELTLEPASQEDLEADLQEFEPGRAVNEAALDGYRLIVQAKLRNGDAWTAAGIKRVLEHGELRESAAQRLVNPAVRYLLVTNAGLNGEARKLRVHRAGASWPSALPPSIGKCLPMDGGGRVGVLAEQHTHWLRSETKRLLTEAFRVPFARWEACHEQLREDARSRMTSGGGRRWTRAELEETIHAHEGCFASSRDLERYIHPTNWQELRELMEKRHAVLIVGQSGTGKSLATEQLFKELREVVPGLSRVAISAEPEGATQLRNDATRLPVLYDIEDPWGKVAFIDTRGGWTAQLRELFSAARRDRMVVATSRIDVLESAGATEAIRPWRFVLETEHYGAEQRAALFRTRIVDLKTRLHPVVRASEGKVLDALASPMEIQKFFDALRMDVPEDATTVTVADIDAAIAKAHHDAIERTVIDQVEQRKDVRAATVLWCLLKIADRLDHRLVREVEDWLAIERSEFHEGVAPLLDFFVAARNLRQVGSVVSYYHPRVEAGIEQSMEHAPVVARLAIRFLIDALVSLGRAGDIEGAHAAARILGVTRQHRRFEVTASQAAQEQIDRWLSAQLAQADAGFEASLRLAAAAGSTGCNVSEVARFLLQRRSDDEHFGFLEWEAPPHDEAWYARMRNDPATKPIVDRFVREMLPADTGNTYSGFNEAAERLAGDLTPAFVQAAAVVVYRGHVSNVDTIAEGALRELDRFEVVVDMAVDVLSPSAEEIEEEAAQKLAIVNGEYGESYAEFLTYDDDGVTAMQFLEAYVVRARGLGEWERLAGHRHLGSIRGDWLRALTRDPSASAAEVAAAVAAGYDGADEDAVWGLLCRAWSTGYSHLLRDRLLRGHTDLDVRIAALRCAFLHQHEQLSGLVVQLLGLEQEPRVLEWAMDLSALETKCARNKDEETASLVREARRSLPAPYDELGQASLAIDSGEVPTVSDRARDFLSSLPATSEGLRLFRLRMDQYGQMPVEQDVRWILANTNDKDAAVVAVSAAVRHAMQEDLRAALTHRFAHVVAYALEVIAAPLPAPLPHEILRLAEAKGNPVRSALIRLLDRKPHLAHLPALLVLSRDRWTDSPGYEEEDETYPIARAALAAISRLGMLEIPAAEQLYRTGVNTQDPQLRWKIFKLLAGLGHPGIEQRLLGLAMRPGRAGPASAAARALIEHAPRIAPEDLSAITVQMIETRDEAVAQLLLALMAQWGERQQLLTVAQSLAANASRRVFLVFLMRRLKHQDSALTGQLADMLPLKHPAVTWALSDADEPPEDNMFDDLGDKPAIDEVRRFLVMSWSRGR
jgi:hypothetical protein